MLTAFIVISLLEGVDDPTPLVSQLSLTPTYFEYAIEYAPDVR